MDFNSIVVGMEIGSLLTLTVYNLGVVMDHRAEQRRDQAAAATAARKLNADLFYVGFKAEQLHSRMRSTQ